MRLKLGLRNKIRRSRAAGGFVGLLDQPFAQGATAAYSVRLLNSNHTGGIIRVREDAGNTEQDFTAAEITDGTLASFCGSANGLVSKWYDQSGNGNDASNSTASEQPKLYDSSSGLVKENGKPTLEFGTGIYLGTGLLLDFDVSAYVVTNPLVSESNISDQRYLFDQEMFGRGFGGRFKEDGLENRTDDGSLNAKQLTITFNKKQLFLCYLFSSNLLVENQDNSSSGTTAATSIKGTDTLDIGSKDFADITNNNFHIQEEIFYNTDNTGDRAKFRTNQQNFYS